MYIFAGLVFLSLDFLYCLVNICHPCIPPFLHPSASRLLVMIVILTAIFSKYIMWEWPKQKDATGVYKIMGLAWKAAHSSKAFGEKVIFYYTLVWITVLATIVLSGSYEYFGPNDYILVGAGISIPCIIAPLLFADKAERSTPLFQRYIVKANIFVFIMGYIGNHFFTHYFYRVLGMRYTGPLGPGEGLEINKVPVSMFLCTHPYFMTYHVLVSPVLRAAKAYLQDYRGKTVLFAIVVVCIAFFTAFMETWTISAFPYYTYPNLYSMLTSGSLFYGTFFVVTYPIFFRIDEDPRSPLWSIQRVVVEALAAMMVVLLCGDIMKLLLIGN